MTHPPSLLRRAVHGLLLIAMLVSTFGALTPSVRATVVADPTSVTIAGSLQSELGCPGDWQPECATTHLTADATDDVWQGTFTVPAGSYEYKAALNDAWPSPVLVSPARAGSARTDASPPTPPPPRPASSACSNSVLPMVAWTSFWSVPRR